MKEEKGRDTVQEEIHFWFERIFYYSVMLLKSYI